MELTDFTSLVPDFSGLSHPEKVKHFGWYIHVYGKQERFATCDIRLCYEALHLAVPNVSDTLTKLAGRRPKILLKSGSHYKLEMRLRQEMDAKYGNRPISIAIEKSLAALPNRLADETQRKYLIEALACYKARCNRAAILMCWNLAYDHLLNWILADVTRITKFNGKLPSRPPFTSAALLITKREDFEWLTEHDVVEICGHRDVAIITNSLKKILLQSLERRNIAAHPSSVEITQVNVEDTISSLVENIVIHLM